MERNWNNLGAPLRSYLMSNIVVLEERPVALARYAQIRIAFEVHRVFDVKALNSGLGGFSFSERELAVPYTKDYDVLESPIEWPRQFDTSNWAFFAAHSAGLRVGGAVVAFDTVGLTMLEGRKDLAALWDIRVAAEYRGQGVGRLLFAAAERWAAAQGCRQLNAETQNTNVPACKFYVRQGCVLGAVRRFAYPDFPGETQLIWKKQLNLEPQATGL